MEYPNNIKKKYQKEIIFSNRGMNLEEIIEEANIYYRDNDIAYIYKKPTPIGISNIKYTSSGKRITDAYFKSPSTLDFNGLYKGKYIEFDAKDTKNTTSFPLNNILPHQIAHIKNIYNHGGIVFLIISMNDKYFLFPGKNLLEFIKENDRKSIPYKYILNNSSIINYNYLKGLDYINIVDKLIKGEL